MSGRNHHFIPRMLLRGFAVHDHVWVLRREGAPEPVHIKEAACKQDFDGPPGDTILDQRLTKQENKVRLDFAAMRDEGRLPGQAQRKRMDWFVCLLLARTKRARQSVAEIAEKYVSVVEDVRIRDEFRRRLSERAPSAPGVSQEVLTQRENDFVTQIKSRWGEPLLSGADDVRNSFISQFKLDKRVAALGDFSLRIVNAARDETFFLGDSAVTAFNRDGIPCDPFMQWSDLAALVLPIGTNRALVYDREGYNRSYSVSDINGASAGVAGEEIYLSTLPALDQKLAAQIGSIPRAVDALDWVGLASNLREWVSKSRP